MTSRAAVRAGPRQGSSRGFYVKEPIIDRRPTSERHVGLILGSQSIAWLIHELAGESILRAHLTLERALFLEHLEGLCPCRVRHRAEAVRPGLLVGKGRADVRLD